jgi:hypothetical protein
MAKFKFEKRRNGYDVSYRGEVIGAIQATKEASGRHSFQLACDKQKQPRKYRGMQRAAEALLVIDRLKKKSSKQRWKPETLITQAWEVKPRISEQGE